MSLHFILRVLQIVVGSALLLMLAQAGDPADSARALSSASRAETAASVSGR